MLSVTPPVPDGLAWTKHEQNPIFTGDRLD